MNIDFVPVGDGTSIRDTEAEPFPREVLYVPHGGMINREFLVELVDRLQGYFGGTFKEGYEEGYQDGKEERSCNEERDL